MALNEIIITSAIVSGFVTLVYNLIRDRNKQLLDIKRDEKINELKKEFAVFETSFSTRHNRFFNEKVDLLKSLNTNMTELSGNLQAALLIIKTILKYITKDTEDNFWDTIDDIRNKATKNYQAIAPIISDLSLYIDKEAHKTISLYYTLLTKIYMNILPIAGLNKSDYKSYDIKDTLDVMFVQLPPIEKQFNDIIKSFFQIES